jgi:hypothetical protein
MIGREKRGVVGTRDEVPPSVARRPASEQPQAPKSPDLNFCPKSPEKGRTRPESSTPPLEVVLSGLIPIRFT